MFVGQSLAAADPAYYPEGPQQNVDIDVLTSQGWDVCYFEDLGTPLTDEIILAQCDAKYVIYAGGEDADPDNLLLLAAGESSSVYQVTATNDTTENNGSFWYFNGSSFGFSPIATISQSTADVCDAVFVVCDAATSDERLSWHNSSAIGGWRIGDIHGQSQGGNDAVNLGPNAWFKVILISNGGSTSAVAPLVMTSAPEISMKDGMLTCTPGAYQVATSKADIDSVSYNLWINGENTGRATFDPGKQLSASVTANKTTTYSAVVGESKAIWDLRSLSNFTAHCQVVIAHHGAMMTIDSTTLEDSVKAAIRIKTEAEKIIAEDLARSAATAANFTQQARELRKRIAARSGN